MWLYSLFTHRIVVLISKPEESSIFLFKGPTSALIASLIGTIRAQSTGSMNRTALAIDCIYIGTLATRGVVLGKSLLIPMVPAGLVPLKLGGPVGDPCSVKEEREATSEMY